MIIYLRVDTSRSITSMCTSGTTLPCHLVFYSSLTSTNNTTTHLFEYPVIREVIFYG